MQLLSWIQFHCFVFSMIYFDFSRFCCYCSNSMIMMRAALKSTSSQSGAKLLNFDRKVEARSQTWYFCFINFHISQKKYTTKKRSVTKGRLCLVLLNLKFYWNLCKEAFAPGFSGTWERNISGLQFNSWTKLVLLDICICIYVYIVEFALNEYFNWAFLTPLPPSAYFMNNKAQCYLKVQVFVTPNLRLRLKSIEKLFF